MEFVRCVRVACGVKGSSQHQHPTAWPKGGMENNISDGIASFVTMYDNDIIP